MSFYKAFDKHGSNAIWMNWNKTQPLTKWSAAASIYEQILIFVQYGRIIRADKLERFAPLSMPPLCKGRWQKSLIFDGGIVMQAKHNKQLVPFAKRLRKEMTKEERHLWYDFLRTYSVRFSRQKVLGKYIADFYSAEAKLVIELDGSQHYEDINTEKDAERTAFLKGYGLTVIRIPNNEVNRNFRGVCAYIDAAVRQSLSQKSEDF